MNKRWLVGLIFACSTTVMASPREESAPIFVGRNPRQVLMPQAAGFRYMTASMMQSKVISLTGYFHPDFDTYSDVIGRYDPLSGKLTNDRPSLVSVLFLQNITAAIASRAIAREIFVDGEGRIVFAPGLDLWASPSEATLHQTILGLYQRWLGTVPQEPVMAGLKAGFRTKEAALNPMSGYEWLLTMMLRHGGLYYY